MNPAGSIPVDHAASVDGLLDDTTSAAAWLAGELACIFGGATRAVLHYGSRAQGRAARPDSAFDFFVIVQGYDEAYAAAAGALGPGCRPRLSVALARLLPPNALALRRQTPAGALEAKALIISECDFQRECSPRSRDHFVAARMIQTVRLVWSCDAAAAEQALGAVRLARRCTFDWARVFLPPAFDLPAYCQTLIAVSFAHELRAEAAGHPAVLYAAQRDLLGAIYGSVLAKLTAGGTLQLRDGVYRQNDPPGWLRRSTVRSYFRWSLLRTSVRLLKHPLLYDGWLDYLTRKVDRSTGQRVALTRLEQRYPFVFLWPRVIRYLLSRSR